MFKILIVEDDREKLRSILTLIKTRCGISEDLIDHEIDSTSARRKIKDNYYDLLIIDIAIPETKSSVIDSEGGIKLVKEILERDHYKVPTHIVGLTSHDEAFEQAVKNFSTNVIYTIRYSDTDSEWEESLSSGINHWKSSKLSASEIAINYDYDVAILTAVDVEFEAVKALSDEWTRIKFQGDSTMYLETFFEYNEKKFKVVIACLSQMGMIASSVLSMKLIYNFRPKYIFMPGIAASVKDKNSHGFGDILVIDESWDGGAGKIGKDAEGNYVFDKNALHLRLDNDLSEKMRAIKTDSSLLRQIKDNFKSGNTPNTELNIHIGSVVSVAGVIANEEISSQLKTHDRKLLGLEMEVYGMYYATNNCSSPKPLAMALKSICDFANSEKDDNYQNYASYTSAQVMFHFILSECIPLHS